jgi:hypothetical protein
LELEINSEKGKTVKTINISQKETHISIAAATTPSTIIADPNTNLFFEWTVTAAK